MKSKQLGTKKENFFMLFRKRGVIETLTILVNQPNFEMTQKLFFQTFNIQEDYPNLFFRVKTNLLEYKLIGYKLSSQNEKVIYLTEKGIRFMEIINQIESMITETPENYIDESTSK